MHFPSGNEISRDAGLPGRLPHPRIKVLANESAGGSYPAQNFIVSGSFTVDPESRKLLSIPPCIFRSREIRVCQGDDSDVRISIWESVLIHCSLSDYTSKRDQNCPYVPSRTTDSAGLIPTKFPRQVLPVSIPIVTAPYCRVFNGCNNPPVFLAPASTFSFPLLLQLRPTFFVGLVIAKNAPEVN